MSAPPTPKPNPKPSSERGQKTYDDILDAADRLFGEHGFQGTQIGQIIEASGVSPSSLYRFFSDKRAIAAALIERYGGTIAELVVLLPEVKSVEDILDLVEASVAAAALHQDANPGFRAVVREFDVHAPPNPLAEIRQAQSEFMSALVRDFVPDVPEQVLRRTIYYVAETIARMLVAPKFSEDSREQQVAEVQRMLRSYVASVIAEVE